MKNFLFYISIFILTIYVGEKKEFINSKLSFFNKEFQYIRHDDWLNYNNTKLNLKNFNNDKLLINIKSKNLNYIKNEFEEIKFELKPAGNIKFYFFCNKDYLQKIIKKNIINKTKEINYFMGSIENNIKEVKLTSNWSTHNDSNFTNYDNEIIINYDNPGYGSHIWNSFRHKENDILVLNFKAKIGKDDIKNSFFFWIGDHYGYDRKRLTKPLKDKFNEYYFFHNSKFKHSNKTKYLGFDSLMFVENKIYIKDLKLNKLNLNNEINLIKLSDNYVINKKFNILVVEFKNLGNKKKTFNLGSSI